MNKAEFDQFADEYYAQHAASIILSGEQPEFFAEYKIADAAKLVKNHSLTANRILDFGSGIGNSVPWFRKYFPDSEVICADISKRSLDLSKQRFPGNETYLEIGNNYLNLPDSSIDMVFSACVFHHIPHEEHSIWFKEFNRILRPRGLLIVFEHNPRNPFTVAVVNKCPFDKNAVLIDAEKLRRIAVDCGWVEINTMYRIFFPHSLSLLRPFERILRSISIGAQYCIYAYKI